MERRPRPHYPPRRSTKYTRSRAKLLTAICALLLLGLAIITPIAVVISRRTHRTMPAPRSNVLVPLYIYPAPGAWDPLHAVVSAHLNLNFTIIVNPYSGPGSGKYPDANYTAQIPLLNAHPNVVTVGYVSTAYATRDKTLVLADVAKYAGWSEQTGLAVQGIFFDETPNTYSGEIAGYLDAVTQAVKAATGIGGSKLVIHNPGTLPSPLLTRKPTTTSPPDVTVVFENAYASFIANRTLQIRLASHSHANPYPREMCGVLVHGAPSSWTSGGAGEGESADGKGFVEQMRRLSGWVFVTDLQEHYYEGFGKWWGGFVDAMDG